MVLFMVLVLLFTLACLFTVVVNIHSSLAYIPGPLSSSLRSCEEKCASLPCYQFTLVAERVRPRSSGVLYLRTPPQQPSGFASVAPGAQAPPHNPAKLGFQPALLRCIQHHPPQLSHREQLGATLGVKRLLASTYHRLSRKLQQSAGCLPDTEHKDGES